MTAVAGVVHRGRVWMAADTRASTEEIAVTVAAGKLRAFGDVLVGVSGDHVSDRVLPLVDWSRDWSAQIAKHREALGVAVDATIELLIGHAGRLWYFDGGVAYEAGERYAAVGSGCLVCLGYLAATPGVPPQDRVRGAVRAAIHHVPSCGGRITVAATPARRST